MTSNIEWWLLRQLPLSFSCWIRGFSLWEQISTRPCVSLFGFFFSSWKQQHGKVKMHNHGIKAKPVHLSLWITASTESWGKTSVNKTDKCNCYHPSLGSVCPVSAVSFSHASLVPQWEVSVCSLRPSLVAEYKNHFLAKCTTPARVISSLWPSTCSGALGFRLTHKCMYLYPILPCFSNMLDWCGFCFVPAYFDRSLYFPLSFHK